MVVYIIAGFALAVALFALVFLICIMHTNLKLDKEYRKFVRDSFKERRDLLQSSESSQAQAIKKV
ncbi:MAG: hypothetical protein FWG63_11535 [Defluviitaleaceae bacterium]|nr:hypothetical protein [Defluviitaleaceae bacterium]